MEFSIFGVVLIVLTILFIIYKFGLQKASIDEGYTSFFLISVVASLLFDVGYIVTIGSFVFEYNYYFSIVCLILAIFVLLKKRLDNSFVIPCLLFVFYLLVFSLVPLITKTTYISAEHGLVWDVYFGSDGKELMPVGITIDSFFIIARTFIFLICFYALSFTVHKQTFEKWIKVLYKLSWAIVILSFIEIVVSNLVDPYVFRSITMDILGHSDSTYLSAKFFRNFYPAMLFMREPSSYVLSLFFLSINNIAYFYYMRKNKVLMPLFNLLAMVLLTLVSFSMSALIYLGVLFIICIYIVGINKGWLPLFVAVVAVPIGMFLFRERIFSIFNTISSFAYLSPNELPYSSEIIRFYSIYNNLYYFIAYPVFGTGLGSIYSFSSFVTLLSNIGIVGVIIFVYLINLLTNKIFGSKTFSFFTIGVVVLAFSLTGHMSLLLYIDKIILLYLLCKYIHLNKLEKKPFFKDKKELLFNEV